MRKIHPVLLIAAAAALGLAGVVAAALGRSQLVPMRYFPESGHLLTEPFISYFDQHGGLETFGYPLTDAYNLPDSTLVQTFQNAQIQLTVRGVELGPLGLLLRLGSTETGATVAPELAGTYQSLGGEAFLGAPLGQARSENGVLTQDFERARLVRDASGRVHLAGLGLAYLTAYPPPQMGQAAIGLRGTPGPPPAVQASVSVAQPTIGQGDKQTIYVLVEDTHGQAISGARSLAVLHYGRATAEVALPATDADGLANARFVAPPAEPGSMVIVQINVLVGDIFLTVDTTYFQWW